MWILQFLSFCIKECDVIKWAKLCVCYTRTATLHVGSCGARNSRKCKQWVKSWPILCTKLLNKFMVFFGLFSFVLKFWGIMESLVGNTTPHRSFLTLYGKSTSQSYNKYKIYKRSIYNKYKYIWNGLDFFLSKLLVKVKLHKNNLISLCIFPILGHFSNWYNYIKCIAGGVYYCSSHFNPTNLLKMHMKTVPFFECKKSPTPDWNFCTARRCLKDLGWLCSSGNRAQYLKFTAVARIPPTVSAYGISLIEKWSPGHTYTLILPSTTWAQVWSASSLLGCPGLNSLFSLLR